jgi:hypothetical protein
LKKIGVKKAHPVVGFFADNHPNCLKEIDFTAAMGRSVARVAGQAHS